MLRGFIAGQLYWQEIHPKGRDSKPDFANKGEAYENSEKTGSFFCVSFVFFVSYLLLLRVNKKKR
jgi:hypothetical protein